MIELIETHLEVDASGLLCPLPLLRLKKALTQIAHGQTVKIITTDPAAHLDFGVFCQQAGHQIIERSQQTSCVVFFIQKNLG